MHIEQGVYLLLFVLGIGAGILVCLLGLVLVVTHAARRGTTGRENYGFPAAQDALQRTEASPAGSEASIQRLSASGTTALAAAEAFRELDRRVSGGLTTQDMAELVSVARAGGRTGRPCRPCSFIRENLKIAARAARIFR